MNFQESILLISMTIGWGVAFIAIANISECRSSEEECKRKSKICMNLYMISNARLAALAKIYAETKKENESFKFKNVKKTSKGTK